MKFLFKRTGAGVLAELLCNPIVIDCLLVDGLTIVVVISKGRVNVGERQMREVCENLVGRLTGLRACGDIPYSYACAGDAGLAATYAGRRRNVLPGIGNWCDTHA